MMTNREVTAQPTGQRNHRRRELYRRVCLCGEVALVEKRHALRMCVSCAKVGKPSNATIGRNKRRSGGACAAA